MEIAGIELQIWLGAVVALVALIVWGLKRYQKMNEDGRFTLDEIIDAIEDGEHLVDKLIEESDKVIKARKCSVCGKTGHNKRTCQNNVE